MIINSYPRNIVWYLEARNAAASDGNMGSGVAVWLRKRDNLSSRKFLLTCGHVVRGKSCDVPAVNGCGEFLKVIHCYAPGSGYATPLHARPADGLPPMGPGDVPVDDRRPARDWVLLDVAEPEFQDELCATGWDSLPLECKCDIVGYPGGAPFPKQIVSNIISEDVSQQQAPPRGVLLLVGTETRPGMSGGGIFNKQGTLVGIHRSRTDATLQLGAVAAEHIRTELSALGWDVISMPLDSVSACIETASDVSEAVRNLAERAKAPGALADTLRGVKPILSQLERDISEMQACKEAHETVLHKIEFKLGAMKMALDLTIKEPGNLQNQIMLKKQMASLRADSSALIAIMRRCGGLYQGGIQDATDLDDAIKQIADRVESGNADPYQPYRLIVKPLIEQIAAELQRALTGAAKQLPFEKLQATVGVVKSQFSEDSLKGLSKIGLMRQVVRRLVAEHNDWQRLHQKLPLLEGEIEKLNQDNNGALKEIEFLFPYITRIVGALATQGDSVAGVDQLVETTAKLEKLIAERDTFALVNTFVDFQTAAISLFREADQRLLNACQQITTVGAALGALNEILI